MERFDPEEGIKELLGSDQRVTQFPELLHEVSKRLIRVGGDKIRQEMRRALENVAHFWDFDAIALGQFSNDLEQFECISSYVSPSIPESFGSKLFEDAPLLIKRMKAGDRVAIKSIPDDLPGDTIADADFCLCHPVKSVLAFPLTHGNSVQVGVVFSSYNAKREWSEDVLRQLRQFGEILVSGLERERMVDKIRELKDFEVLLSDVSARYINLPIDQVEPASQYDFERLARFLGADMCVFHLFPEYRNKLPPSSREWETFLRWISPSHPYFETTFDEIRRKEPEFDEAIQYLEQKWRKGKVCGLGLEGRRGGGKMDKKLVAIFKNKSSLSVPVLVEGIPVGALVIASQCNQLTFQDELIPRLRLMGEVIINALLRKQLEDALRNALSDVRKLKGRLEIDYSYLRDEINVEHESAVIFGQNKAMKQVLTRVQQGASADITILILGETGVGKGVIARVIHNLSPRSRRPLVQINLPSLTPNLIESELFGHEKGAFTGAYMKKMGRFELANETTLFLDEIGDLPLDLQVKLLRVLESGEFERVGGTRTIKSNVRVIAATNRDLQREVNEGRFRADLWYRLNIFPILIPPLRERPEDIPMYLNFFVKRFAKKFKKHFDTVPQKTIEILKSCLWPGNVRELQNLVERAFIISQDGRLQIEVPSQWGMTMNGANNPITIKRHYEYEREYILNALENTGWKIQGADGAAKLLGFHPSTLRFRMKKHNIRRQGFPAHSTSSGSKS